MWLSRSREVPSSYCRSKAGFGQAAVTMWPDRDRSEVQVATRPTPKKSVKSCGRLARTVIPPPPPLLLLGVQIAMCTDAAAAKPVSRSASCGAPLDSTRLDSLDSLVSIHDIVHARLSSLPFIGSRSLRSHISFRPCPSPSPAHAFSRHHRASLAEAPPRGSASQFSQFAYSRHLLTPSATRRASPTPCRSTSGSHEPFALVVVPSSFTFI